MGLLSIINHFGTFLLLVSTILLIVASISAPTVNSISFLTVDMNGGEITFGSFGYCVRRDGRDDWCSDTSIGYNPGEVISRVDGVDYSTARENTAEGLTNVMVLHPVAAGISFIGFLLSLGTTFFGSLFASMTAMTGFIVCLIALVCDWVWMSLIRNNVNDEEDGGDESTTARYDHALWIVLAAAICSFIASIILFFTCCAGRRNKRSEKGDFHSPPARRGWFGRKRY